MKKIFIIIISIFLISFNAYSKVGSNAGYAGSFMRMGLGARALGMGNTGVACSNNGFASYYNPAALPYLPGRHLSLTYYFLSLDREFHYAGFAFFPLYRLNVKCLGTGSYPPLENGLQSITRFIPISDPNITPCFKIARRANSEQLGW